MYQKWTLFLLLFSLFSHSLQAQCASSSNIYSFSIGNTNYEVVKEQRSWQAAASCAAQRGGHLAHIDSQSEQDSIYDTINNGAAVASNYTVVNDGGGIAYVWIGANDIQNEGAWYWDGDNDSLNTINFWNGQGAAGNGSGSAVGGSFQYWGGASTGTAREPDNFNNQDAAAIALAGWPAPQPGALGVAGEWNDIDVSNTLYYVIEYPACTPTSFSQSITACDSFVSPSNMVYYSSGQYNDTLTNAGGCDSVVTTNLTITTINATAALDGVDVIAVDSTADSYQWLDCNNGNTPVAAAISFRYSPTTSGSYAVEITRNNCTKISNCVAVSISSVSLQTKPASIQLFPNPSPGLFTLNGIKEPAIAEVFDALGRLKAVFQLNDTTSKLDLQHLPAGTYLLRVQEGAARSTLKFIKQ